MTGYPLSSGRCIEPLGRRLLRQLPGPSQSELQTGIWLVPSSQTLGRQLRSHRLGQALYR